MNRVPSLLVALLLTVSAAGQTAQFGFLVGGAKRLNEVAGTQGEGGIDEFKFSHSVKEAYYRTELDEGNYFRIKGGQIDLPLIFDQSGTPTAVKGKIQHIDALVDYRFSEAFGSTGLFAGAGMYRQSASGHEDDTNVGLSGGFNADFPLSRRYGIIAEATYHWVRTEQRQRFITLTGGLRISF